MYVECYKFSTVALLLDRVPIYAASSWASIMSLTAAFYLDTLRDIYEVERATAPAESFATSLTISRPSPSIPFSNY